MTQLFRHGLTPQRKFLLSDTRERISRRTLRTSDLQLSLLHFRDANLGGEWLKESAHSIAHVRRNQGILRAWGLRVWGAHLYYQNLKRDDLNVTILPLDIFETICWLIEDRSEWQLQDELDDILPHGVTKQELLATLRFLYQEKSEKNRNPVFVQLVSKGGNPEEDIRFVRRLVLCEPMALTVGPTPIDEIVDAVDKAFCETITKKRFTKEERTYVQPHLLVSLHNVLLDVRSDVFKAITHQDPPNREAMLSVSAMDNNLGVDVAFYFRRAGKYLDQADLYSPDPRSERLRCPLLRTNLSEETFLLESDINIRSCLFNHPLEVRKHPNKDYRVMVALERGNAEFKPTRSRLGEPNY